MVVAPFQPAHESRPWRSVSLALAALLALSVPVAANHVQTESSNGATFTIEFDHGGDNEWWVEVEARGSEGDSIFIMFATVEDTSTGHYMKFVANDFERQQQGWSKFAPDRSFQVPAGKRVLFEAHLTDGVTGETGIVRSCWFTHPAGVEQCDSGGSTFNAPFTGVRGNAWWIQANVGTNGPAIAKVDATLDKGTTWKPLAKQSWGPTAWAASFHIPQGTIVQLRATASTGETDLSSCRQWVPPSGQDAQIVDCGTQPQPGAFDATFSGVKGNNWWVQTSVSANEPLAGVGVRVDCAPQWRPLTKQSYGWSASFNIPSGSKVDFMATSADGDVDASGGYTWTAATPTSGCALGAWPKEGSRATYDFDSGVCGGGECFKADATLQLVYSGGRWTGVCNGTDTHSRTDGTVDEVPWSVRLDGVAPPFQSAKTVGAQVEQKNFSTHYGQRTCTFESGPTLTIDRQEMYPTAMMDGNGNQRSTTVWLSLRDMPEENGYDMRHDTKLGMVVQAADYPRRSAQGSSWMVLTDTDAPLALSSVVA